MRRVLYRCESGCEFAVNMPDSERPDDTSCECGQPASWFRIQVGVKEGEHEAPAPYCFVKGRPYEQQGRYQVMPQGERYGVSAARQAEHYREHFTRLANDSRAFRGGHSKLKSNAPEYLGGMSGEQMHSIGLQERDPEAVAKDPITFLKKTGNYVGE